MRARSVFNWSFMRLPISLWVANRCAADLHGPPCMYPPLVDSRNDLADLVGVLFREPEIAVAADRDADGPANLVGHMILCYDAAGRDRADLVRAELRMERPLFGGGALMSPQRIGEAIRA
jgi:hypothetical protein